MNFNKLSYPFLFIFSFFSIYTTAQNTVQINGTAVDNITELPVEAATVYLSLKKDSTVVEYSLTDTEGKFKLDLKKINEPVFFTVTDDLFGDYIQEFDDLNQNRELGIVKLSQKINLEGVMISGAPPVRIKNDTLEFNASSFKVRPDANVETLLKQLPGVDIDENGKITVNGKEVNQILVNGKPFFDKDGKIALENLPAEIINKIQVTDTKTKKEELSGQKASSNNATINLTIDEDKNKGIMLKAMAGYGTDDRYESSLMLNSFKGDSRLSVLGSFNNINSVGFSMNEIFDNMGSMRNSSVWVDNNSGSFSINGMSFGGGAGITQSELGGLSYSNNFGKDIELNSNYFYTQSDTKNNNYSRRQNLLPENIFTTESNSITRNRSFAHNFNNSVEVKIDSTSTIWFEPKYSYNKAKSSNIFNSLTYNEDDDLTNESRGEKYSESLNQSFSNSIEYYKSFPSKTSLSLSLSNDNKRAKNDDYDTSNTYFYQTGEPDDLRNQLSKSRTRNDNYDFGLEFEIPLTDSLKISVGTEYEIKQRKKSTETNDYDEMLNEYSVFNDRLSSNISSDFYNLKPFVALKLQKNKIFFRINAGLGIMEQKNDGYYMSDSYELNQRKVVPDLNFYANYKFSKNSSLYMNYRVSESFATAEQLLAIENLSNPLNTTTGNPNLKTNRNHSLYFGFRDFNFQTRSGYNIYAGGSYSERSLTSYRITDENFKSKTTYVNVEGNYNLWIGLNYNKSFSSGRNKFRVGVGMNAGHNYNQGFANEIKYDAYSYNLRPRVNFNWEIDKVLIINPSYNINYQFNKYKNYRIDQSNNLAHIFKIATTNYWPKNFVFGNDFSYTYNSNISSGLKKDFFLWNTSLAYNFMNDKLTFKVKVYDILGQNTGTSRTISDTFISDSQDNVLERYVMFSLGFKLDQFGGKKQRRNRFIMFD